MLYLVRQGSFYLIDILIIPATLALYFALAGINQSRLLTAASFFIVGATVELAAHR
jgi:predicted ATP-grasp superfamily ATP-dependent carboligase